MSHTPQQNKKVFIAFGANLDQRIATIRKSCDLIQQAIPLNDWSLSSLYLTTPVSSLPQPLFINCVASFTTHLSPLQLLKELQLIEQTLKKGVKSKDAPRHIDLDILFYECFFSDEEPLCIPHPRWQTRHFVIYPLKELTKTISFMNQYKVIETINLENYLHELGNPHNESLIKLPKDINDQTLEDFVTQTRSTTISSNF